MSKSQSEMADIVYDTLFQNKDWEQFEPDYSEDQELTRTLTNKDYIEFVYGQIGDRAKYKVTIEKLADIDEDEYNV